MPNRLIDGTDADILRALQGDARLTNLDLAAKIDLSPSPCLRRVRLLQSDGVISGFRAVLDRRGVGLGLTMVLMVDINQHSEEAVTEKFRRAISKMPEVITCYAISGGHDFFLEVVAVDLAGYRKFLIDKLLKLPMIVHVESSFVIETVKPPSILPLDHLGTQTGSGTKNKNR